MARTTSISVKPEREVPKGKAEGGRQKADRTDDLPFAICICHGARRPPVHAAVRDRTIVAVTHEPHARPGRDGLHCVRDFTSARSRHLNCDREIGARWDFPSTAVDRRWAQGQSWDAVERVAAGFMVQNSPGMSECSIGVFFAGWSRRTRPDELRQPNREWGFLVP